MLSIKIPNQPDSVNYHTAVVDNDLVQITKLLRENRNPNKGKLLHPLFLSIYHERLEIFKKLLRCPRISLTIRNFHENQATLLIGAVNPERSHSFARLTSIDTRFIDEILKKDKSNILVNLSDKNGKTVLFYTIKNLSYYAKDNIFEILGKLIEVPNIDLNLTYKGNNFIFFLLNYYFRLQEEVPPLNKRTIKECLSFILKKILKNRSTLKFNPNQLIKGESLLYRLVYLNDLENVKLLLDFPDLDINQRNSSNHNHPITPLQRAILGPCKKMGIHDKMKENISNWEICKSLILDHRINLDKCDHLGKSPLQYALNKRKVQVLRLIFSSQKRFSLECLMNIAGLKEKFGNILFKKGQIRNRETFNKIKDFFMLSSIEEIMEVLEIGNKPPVHISPLALSYYSKIPTSFYWITEKADGIYTNNLPSSIYPDLPKENNLYIEAEWLSELNLYLIFNVISPNIAHLNYGARMEWLRRHHPKAPTKQASSFIKNLECPIYKNEMLLLKDFVQSENSLENKPRWWPKFAFQLQRFDEKYPLISFLEDYSVLETDEKIKNNVFPTDGYILIPDSEKCPPNLLKIKPKNHSTVDLRFDQEIGKFFTREGDVIKTKDSKVLNGVYRCYWSEDDGIWVPIELRREKKEANPNYIVDEITRYHKNPWNLSDIKEMVESAPYYKVNPGKVLNNVTQQFLMLQKKAEREYMHTCLKSAKMTLEKTNIMQENNLLDIGFGKQATKKTPIWEQFNTFYGKKGINLYGIDIDVSLLYPAQERYGKGNWVLGDFGKKWNFNSSLRFKTILSINSAHFAGKNKNSWETFISEINQRTVDGAYWFLVFLDADLLKDVIKDSQLKFGDTDCLGFIKRHNRDGIHLLSADVIEYWIEYNYPWIGCESIKEPCISYKKLIVELEPQWKIESSYLFSDFIKEINNNNELLNSGWSVYANCFRYLLLKKKPNHKWN